MWSRCFCHAAKAGRSILLRFPSTKLINGSLLQPKLLSRGCSGQLRLLATQAESRLAEVLKQEIASETKVDRQKVPQPQTTIPGFQIKTDEAEVVLSKSHGDETIKITFNVNNSVDPEDSPPHDSSDLEAPLPAMVSRPEFEIEVSKGNQKMIFNCFIERPYHDEESPPPHEHEVEDGIRISEISSFSGVPGDKFKVFTVSGDNVDGSLYEGLLDYLAERGIDDKFIKNLMAFSTHYEHTQYVALLHKIKDFVGQK